MSKTMLIILFVVQCLSMIVGAYFLWSIYQAIKQSTPKTSSETLDEDRAGSLADSDTNLEAEEFIENAMSMDHNRPLPEEQIKVKPLKNDEHGKNSKSKSTQDNKVSVDNEKS